MHSPERFRPPRAGGPSWPRPTTPRLIRPPQASRALIRRGFGVCPVVVLRMTCRLRHVRHLRTQKGPASFCSWETWVAPSVPLNKGKEPADVAFLAMAHQRIGHPGEARATLDRLRDVMRQAGPDVSQRAATRAFLAEAESVVLSDPIFPGDPFAP